MLDRGIVGSELPYSLLPELIRSDQMMRGVGTLTLDYLLDSTAYLGFYLL